MALCFPKAPGQHVAGWAQGTFGVFVVLLAAATGAAAAATRAWSWLDVVWVCSSIKLCITILKWLVRPLPALRPLCVAHPSPPSRKSQ